MNLYRVKNESPAGLMAEAWRRGCLFVAGPVGYTCLCAKCPASGDPWYTSWWFEPVEEAGGVE